MEFKLNPAIMQTYACGIHSVPLANAFRVKQQTKKIYVMLTETVTTTVNLLHSKGAY